MDIKVEIKEGKNTTSYTIDFTPTEDKIKEVAKNVSTLIKSIVPKVTKETKENIV